MSPTFRHMRGMLALPAILTLFLPTSARTETEVELSGGRMSIRARSASLGEVMEKVESVTGIRVVYDGALPPDVFHFEIAASVPSAALQALLDQRKVKYAMALDRSGTGVEAVVITTMVAR